MPKRRAPSDEEDEVGDSVRQSASEEVVVKKSKKSTAKSEKAKASVRFDGRDSYRPTAVLTFVLRHNLATAKNRRKEKKLLQTTERSRLTKREISTLIWGVTGERRFASLKACYQRGQTRFGKIEMTRITIQVSRSSTSASILAPRRTRNQGRRGSP